MTPFEIQTCKCFIWTANIMRSPFGLVFMPNLGSEISIGVSTFICLRLHIRLTDQIKKIVISMAAKIMLIIRQSVKLSSILVQETVVSGAAYCSVVKIVCSISSSLVCVSVVIVVIVVISSVLQSFDVFCRGFCSARKYAYFTVSTLILSLLLVTLI